MCVYGRGVCVCVWGGGCVYSIAFRIHMNFNPYIPVNCRKRVLISLMTEPGGARGIPTSAFSFSKTL